MRDAGDLVLEHDFSTGSDTISQILNEPQSAEHTEFELFGWLPAYI